MKTTKNYIYQDEKPIILSDSRLQVEIQRCRDICEEIANEFGSRESKKKPRYILWYHYYTQLMRAVSDDIPF